MVKQFILLKKTLFSKNELILLKELWIENDSCCAIFSTWQIPPIMNEQSSVDESVIVTLKGLMKDRFNFLIDTFISKTQTQLDELQQAINTNNIDNIILITHSLKGSAGSVGAGGMHLLCKEYESAARSEQLDGFESWPEKLSTEFNRYCEGIKAHL